MIYLFGGDDIKNKLISYEKFIKSISKDTEVFYINRNNLNRDQIESLQSGAGLFFTKCIVVFSNIFEYEETRDFTLDKLDLMGQSESTFVFLESKLNKPILEVFKKSRAELNIFELPKEKKERFDNFLVANAFSQKDKLNMWIYFRQAIDKGVVMEELIGVLFWKIKDMMIKKDFRKFSRTELLNSATKLSCLLPKARKEGNDAETVFERFLLEVF